MAIKNLKTGAVTELATDGVFIFVGTVPRTEFLRGKLDLDERGYIPTTELMETSVDGVYAVGDVRQKFLRQVVTAAADGAIAAVAAEKYIHEEENFRKEVLKRQSRWLMFWSPFHKESLAAVPVVEEVAAANAAKLDLVKIDTYRNQRIARRYGVEEMPALLLVKGGEVAGAVTGPMSRDSLEDLIKSI